MSLLFGTQNQTKLLGSLLDWYKKHGRHDMPWRNTQDPYAILVSEYMLQQTTVTAVRPYYEKFLKRFPTMGSLAKAPLDDVLALWSGLGYYARARNLWAAVRMVEKEFDGKIPSDQMTLQRLPGVGLYISGAVTAFAFNKPAIVLDGNIIRVLMRLLAIEEDPRLKAVQIILRKVSLELTQASHPRHVVLALMDIGATVCLPQTPNCLVCPLNDQCLARIHGRQSQIPAKGDEVERVKVHRLYAVIEKRSQWLLARRPKEGLFGGLWEFIGIDVEKGEDPIEKIERAVKAETGLAVRVIEALKGFDHSLSHREFHIQPYRMELIRSKPKALPKKGRDYDRFRWVAPRKLELHGLSAITKKILKLAKN